VPAFPGSGHVADFRYFRCEFWNDPYVVDLGPEEKLLFAWLFTNKHVNQAGLMKIHRKTIAFETGLDGTVVDGGLAAFEKAGKIQIDGETILVVNFGKHQSTSSPKLRTRILRDLADFGESRLVDEFRRRYPTLAAGFAPPNTPPTTPPIPVNERKGKEGSIDTVSIQYPPLPKNISFKHRDEIAELKLSQKDLERKIAVVKEKGRTATTPFSIKDLECQLHQVNRRIADILEAYRE
jgi:hypothetical protein